MAKQTSPEVSSIAGRLLRDGRPPWMPESYWDIVSALAGSCLSQDETPATETDPGTEYQRRLDEVGEPLGRIKNAISPRGGDAWGEPESQREDPLGR